MDDEFVWERTGPYYAAGLLDAAFEQLANQEVASALGLTEAAASMRYLRAIRRLRDLMTPAS